ncbi:MAG: uroporphyrinogen-III synthase [Thiohalocapsa sp.]|jgi:uroporphyrinogen-III synthase|uniref:uroporphyrinogen-III synthase n=1 Tax=Thiohalocapsa sp. TaxID=2497641 RepID=UPI0025EAA0F0|nr:uroporphyrinogen-III synthase [Thiohalocapsa sp.]MCG6943614.1 uroporphyrinogen-III synthase [Thiohalocapsa sp.]
MSEASAASAPANAADCHLAGRGVLVTRPAAQADGLCRLVEAAGGRPVRFPTVDIRPPTDPAAAAARLVEPWDCIVFISRNAVEGALALAGDALHASPARLAAVGRATAAAMKRAGMAPSLVPDAGFDSEALLAMPALTAIAGQRVLIVRGEGGRALLGNTLAGRGADVAYAEVYRRAAPSVDPAEQLPSWQQTLGFVTATSDEVLHNLLALVPAAEQPWLKDLPLAVLSARNAETARGLGFTRVAVAPQPGDDGMLAALCALARETGAGTQVS